MKVAVIGSRTFKNYGLVVKTLKELAPQEIISGGAAGADSLGAQYAEENKIKLTIFPANWNDLTAPNCKIKVGKFGKQYNALAGFNRNLDIINSSDLIVAFWDGVSPGTAHSLKYAKEQGKPTHVILFNIS